MNICFFTEMPFSGRIERTHRNARTEFAWMAALDAVHLPIDVLSQSTFPPTPAGKFDIGIIILPKKNIGQLMKIDIIGSMKKMCNKICFMQEGPHWLFQDFAIEQQIWYIETLSQMDRLLCHNSIDCTYFEGLTGVDAIEMPSLMIEDNINNLPIIERKNTIIGGNFCSWYGGVDSFITAMEFETPIYAPSMGRKIENEELIGINHLPYMDWTSWIYRLNEFKYAVHLMRTHAAGTFALNTAFLGIPCIGWKSLDTQEICHPMTTLPLGDLSAAKYVAKRLKNDPGFYNECATEAKILYKNNFGEEQFKKTMNHILTRLIGETLNE